MAAGDYIPAGSAGWFINPADTVKTEFVPGSGRFTAANFSYAVLDLSRHDGDERPLMPEWKESINTQGDPPGRPRRRATETTPALRSSVWTRPGSGDWRGSFVRGDGSTSIELSPGGTDLGLRYGKRVFEGGDALNFFSNSFGLTSGGEITSTSGILYDEAEASGDANGF